jgi:CDP-4-dehydro-6-deoxyglucose reductase, E1
MTDYKQDISNFIDSLSDKYGVLPKFAHNLRPFNNKVFYSGFYWNKNEIQAALESFLFGDWSINGTKVAQFEREFSKKVNQKYSISTNSGSSANLVMLAAVKKKFKLPDNSKALCSVCAFPTTVSVIPQNKLTPVFVDISWDDLNMDIEEAERIIERERDIKIVIYAPTLGNPGKLDRLKKICDKNGVILCLDLCDSLGSKLNGKQLNEYGLISSCSFFASHHASVIQAGMVSTNDSELLDICQRLIMWSRDCYCKGIGNALPNGTCKKRQNNWLQTQPDIKIDHKYYFTERGYNLQLLEFQGAIGCEQIKKLDEIHEKRIKNHNIIKDLFKTYVSDLTFPSVVENAEPSWFGVGIITKDYNQKRKLVDFLESHFVQTRNFFSGNLLEHPGFSDLGDWRLYPKSSEVLRRVFFVGCAPSYTEENEINYIESVLKKWKAEYE